ncbi:MAG: RNA polymerase sigma factor [Chloroflexota bacterium]
MVDHKLLQRATQGDQDAIALICDLTWRQVYRFAYQRVQNREDAEDVTQETYVRSLPAFSRTNPAALPGYLRTVALNVIRDRWRHKRVTGTQVELQAIDLPTADPANEIVDRELVSAALARLPDDQRTVLELRLIRGFSTAETAARMSRSEGAVRSLQFRAIQALREMIQ